jgi:predicted nucleic acid-binding protein
MALVLDTGVSLALLNAEDRYHEPSVRLLRKTKETLVVPAATLGELNYWVLKRMDVRVWQTFAADIEAGAYRLEPTTEDDLVRAAEIEVQYESLKLGFVDAAVIALCERLGEPKVATVDRRNFSVVVPRHVPTLELLPHLMTDNGAAR